jgi:hypothetical protein
MVSGQLFDIIKSFVNTKISGKHGFRGEAGEDEEARAWGRCGYHFG